MNYLFLSTGFEEIEALTTVDLLRRAGISLQTVSCENELLVKGSHDIKVMGDRLFKEVDFSDAEMLILPGGSRRLGEFAELLSVPHLPFSAIWVFSKASRLPAILVLSRISAMPI